MGDVVAQRLHERLVRDDGLLVDPPVEHGRAARVRLGGEARGQARLAHAGLARQHHHGALARPGALPAPAQRGELGLAADERALLARGEHGRERERGGGGSRRGRRRRLAQHEQAVVQRGDVRRGRGAELVAQQDAQAVVDAQRLGDVAARRQQLHQHRVAGLAIGLALDQGARRAVGGRQLAAAQPQRRPGERLERVGVQPVELGALLVDPAPGELREQRALEQLDRLVRPSGGAARVAGRQRRLGVPRRFAGGIDVEPHVREREPQLRAPLDRVGPQRAPHAGEQRGQAGVRRARRVVVPHHVDELVAPHRPLAVEREVREQEPPLAARQVLFDATPVDLDGQGAAQLDSRGHGLLRTVTAPTNL